MAVVTVVAAAFGPGADRADAQSADGGHFSDDDGSVHEPDLEALAGLGVLAGMECGEGLICPGEPLKRWEMAVWLIRVLDNADPNPIETSHFADVDAGLWWAPFVDRLFELGVTSGCRTEPARFCPDRNVDRAQMATFLKNAFALDPAPPAGFTDVDAGATHSAAIDALAGAGVTAGCRLEPLRYCPDRAVTRAQMATFLARAAGYGELPAAVRFTSIDAGHAHTCGLRADGTVACWGDNSYGQSNAPDGEFISVAAGARNACGIRNGGSVECWGADESGQSNAPDGEFISVAAGARNACGIRSGGSVECWGADESGQSNAPDGEFISVAAGARNACGIRSGGSVECWGADESGQSNAPDGQFISISAGDIHSCGVRSDGSVLCWGRADHLTVQEAPPGEFSQVSAGPHHSCGVRAEGSIYCWGFSADGQAASPGGAFRAVTAGGHHTCGLLQGGAVSCWGHPTVALAGVPEGEFSAIASRWKHACGLRTDGSVSCWGHEGSGRSYPPDGTFVGVTAGHRHTCAVRTDRTVSCWGDSANGRTRAPSGDFVAVSAGQDHSCGLRTDASIACWGANDQGQTEPPGGEFRAVTSGSHHSCGIRLDNSVSCWGLDGGHLRAPSGQFEAVAAGDRHSCGLRTDRSVACWSDLSSQAAAPAGEFRAVTAGYGHSCGIRADATVACWGDDTWGQSTPPGGSFTAVAAGYSHSCGLRPDRSIECWGAEVVMPPTRVRDAGWREGPDPQSCRPYGVRGATTAGLPLPHWAVRSSGVVRVAVLFLDFPDAAATHSTHREAELGLPFMEEYVERASYGTLDIRITPLHGWLRAGHGHAHYATGGIDAEAVRLADPAFDFTGYDLVMTVMPSSHFSDGATFGHARTDEGAIRVTLRINFLPLPQPRPAYRWGVVAAHEFLHTLGLLDLYPSDGSVHRRPAPSSGETWLEARFGIMTLRGFFLASERDDRASHVWRSPGGDQWTAYSHLLDARETLAWSRWLLGWLDRDQIRCVTEPRATVILSPVADPRGGIAMAAVPLGAHDVIVIESRRRIGYDAGVAHAQLDGERTTLPGLASEGVLVYTVDASLAGGLLPIKLAGDVGNGQVDGYPVLGVGASVTVRGYTITVTADDGDTHTVTITKDGEG